MIELIVSAATRKSLNLFNCKVDTSLAEPLTIAPFGLLLRSRAFVVPFGETRKSTLAAAADPEKAAITARIDASNSKVSHSTQQVEANKQKKEELEEEYKAAKDAAHQMKLKLKRDIRSKKSAAEAPANPKVKKEAEQNEPIDGKPTVEPAVDGVVKKEDNAAEQNAGVVKPADDPLVKKEAAPAVAQPVPPSVDKQVEPTPMQVDNDSQPEQPVKEAENEMIGGSSPAEKPAPTAAEQSEDGQAAAIAKASVKGEATSGAADKAATDKAAADDAAADKNKKMKELTNRLNKIKKRKGKRTEAKNEFRQELESRQDEDEAAKEFLALKSTQNFFKNSRAETSLWSVDAEGLARRLLTM